MASDFSRYYLGDFTDSTAGQTFNFTFDGTGTAMRRYGYLTEAATPRIPKPEDPDYLDWSLQELRNRIDGFRL